ncbi:MAG: putative toxin-antitoxin system toxin component, PIN family [Acidimicrobiales bacterium]
MKLRAVLDPNVLISALLTSNGSSARVFRAWLDGEYELVASPLLLAELERACAYPKIRKRVDPAEVTELVDLIRREAKMTDDPNGLPIVRSPDPGDDYLISLAETAHAMIISGDGHLLGMADTIPVYSPAKFLELLRSSD